MLCKKCGHNIQTGIVICPNCHTNQNQYHEPTSIVEEKRPNPNDIPWYSANVGKREGLKEIEKKDLKSSKCLLIILPIITLLLLIILLIVLIVK